MPFPESSRETYTYNPLREVICQLRFPPILKVSAELPAVFQQSIRSDYPLYSEESPTINLPKEVGDILASLPLSKNIPQQVTHKFETEDHFRFISLNQNFLALTEKKYQQWRCFRQELDRSEKSFREIYSPAFYNRIGLRYQNIIDKEALGLDNLAWSELLNKSLIGLSGAGEISNEVREIRTQSLLKLPDPPNSHVRILHGLMVEKEQKQVYIIDSDFFSDERSELDNVFTTLDRFNALAARFFRWAITSTLREALGPTPIE